MKKLTLLIALLLMFTGFHVYSSVKTTIDRDSNFVVFNKSKNIEEVKIRKSKKSGAVLYITVGVPQKTASNNNVTAIGISGKSESEELRNKKGPIFDHIEVLNGGYDDIKVDKLNSSQNVYTIEKVNFPLRLKVKSGNEQVEFELKEVGKWNVEINYKK
ncbi:hypothetical protein OQZ33_10330 [Pedobacter sp. MC2016-05]|uniref:hypothetical protein n=1 Tax=Pedobacter sp. MC2016-05 TaxID=2994474 RepID=UPI0022455566|nr:hypothetical protein [Pedobacter sp. MC2016-05]MCX2474725.1 hypothetical protein [Pedobacter sp. MC2016-05]